MVATSKKADKPTAYKKNVTLTKKWMSKMRKKGKVRRSDLSKINKYSKLNDDALDEKTSKLTDDLEALRAQDAQFFDKLAENFGFDKKSSSSSDDEDMPPASKKSKNSPTIKEEPKSDDEQTDTHPLLEVRYARSNFATAGESNDDKSNLKHLLPIKNAAGKILQVVRKVDTKDEEETEEERASEIEQDNLEKEKMSKNEPISTSKLFADRAQLLDYYKRDIAAKASAIIANPQQNMSKLKSLVQMSAGVEIDSLVLITVQKLAAASSLEIFMDILPSYSIRKWSEAEEKQQMKKETKLLHEYEEALLRHYQKFLNQLDKFCKCNMKKKLNRIKLTPKLVESCQTLGVKCVTRLLADQYHFNFRQNLLETIVPLMSYKDETIRNLCCESVETVFKNDKLGEASFDIVKSICKFVKDNPTKSHPRMLETFLQLKIKEVEKIDQMARTKRDLMAKKRKIKMMSRKERKTFKRLKKLDDDLAELEAEEKKENVLKFHTKIMSQIFAVYFRVLKREKLGNQPLNKCKILPVVLRGLSKFAHFINIEFFDDLLNSLLNLVLQADLNVTESLNCVKTAFVILSGEGQALNIDPYGFYRFVYHVLPKIADEKRIALRKEQLCTALQCLDFMLNKRRKQVTIGRVAAFVKRLVILAPKFSAQEVISVLHGVRTYFTAHPKIECLIDDENQGIGSGFYMPALDDPDRCNAQATSIIEDLKKVQQSFEHKTVKRLCSHILNGLPSNGVHSLDISSTEKSPWLHLGLEE